MQWLQRFLVTMPGSALRVAVGFIVAAVIAVFQAGSVAELGTLAWWQTTIAGAVGVALPILIAWFNPADGRFGRTS